MKKWFLGILVGLVMLGTAGIALAHGWGGDGPEMGPPDPSEFRAEFQKGLNGLVADKVITDQQATTVLQYFDRAAEELKGLPPYEMMDKMRQMRDEGRDPLGLLVKDKVLSQAQADAVRNVFPGPGGKGRHLMAMMKARFQHNLDVLAKSDFITAKQAETVLAYFDRAIQELRKQGPPSEPKSGAIWEKGKDPLSLLVKDGVITAKQADVIALVVPAPPMAFHHRRPCQGGEDWR